MVAIRGAWELQGWDSRCQTLLRRDFKQISDCTGSEWKLWQA
jgi:hypothetical protein